MFFSFRINIIISLLVDKFRFSEERHAKIVNGYEL